MTESERNRRDYDAATRRASRSATRSQTRIASPRGRRGGRAWIAWGCDARRTHSIGMGGAVSADTERESDVHEPDPLWLAIGKAHQREELVLRWLKEARLALWLAEKELSQVRAKKKDLLNRKLRLGRYGEGSA